MNSALPHVIPSERESYIASRMLRAAFLEHANRLAEWAWASGKEVTLIPPNGMVVDAAAKELTVQLEAYGLMRRDPPPVAASRTGATTDDDGA